MRLRWSISGTGAYSIQSKVYYLVTHNCSILFIFICLQNVTKVIRSMVACLNSFIKNLALHHNVIQPIRFA